MRKNWWLALALIASPAQADVKAGVDAWSRGDYAAAIKEWRPAAIAGDADAQFNLGQAYKLGRGVEADPNIAEDWYRRAALQGHIQAEDSYGRILFENGNRQQALLYLEKSVARGEPRAQYLLGTALFNGDMIPRDWVRAYALMTRASAAGLAPASTNLAQMDQHIPLDQRQRGAVLARAMEAEAAKQAVIVPPPPKAVKRAAPKQQTAVAPPKPAPKPAATPLATGGAWRIQLGAFGDPSGARALWGKVGGRLGGLQPYYVKAGAVTRLQAGGLANKAAAERACTVVRGSGNQCLVVAP